MVTAGCCRIRLVAGAALSTAWISIGCSTTAVDPPSAPSTVPSPALQYFSLVGLWLEETSGVRYRDSEGISRSYGCDAMVTIETQTEGTISGHASLNGIGIDSDKNCVYSSPFTAQITPGGTVTAFRFERTFNTFDCGHVADGSVTGTITSKTIHIEITDRATCRFPPGDPRAPFIRDADRVLIMSVTRCTTPPRSTCRTSSGES